MQRAEHREREEGKAGSAGHGGGLTPPPHCPDRAAQAVLAKFPLLRHHWPTVTKFK
jgi:hypothetical protein